LVVSFGACSRFGGMVMLPVGPVIGSPAAQPCTVAPLEVSSVPFTSCTKAPLRV